MFDTRLIPKQLPIKLPHTFQIFPDPSPSGETADVNFDIPIENKWNTHVKPEWQITLYDEDWKLIKTNIQ